MDFRSNLIGTSVLKGGPRRQQRVGETGVEARYVGLCRFHFGKESIEAAGE